MSKTVQGMGTNDTESVWTASSLNNAPINGEELTSSEDESLKLARRLMEEEALASYERSLGVIQYDENLSSEDRQAMQMILQQDHTEEMGLDEAGVTDEDLSYETMLHIGERIGDVKSERWALRSEKEIQKLPSFRYSSKSDAVASSGDDSEHKCLVCQCEYEDDDDLRRLPCNHCFHTECAFQWLRGKDFCPYCRTPII